MPSRYGTLALLLVAIPPLLLRLKQVSGYHRFSGWRLLIPISLFATLLGFTLKASLSKPTEPAIAWVMTGTVIGLACAGLARSNLVFAFRPEGLFYRTAAWIQWTVLVLFLGRVAYRLVFGDRNLHVTDARTLAFAAMLFTYHLAFMSVVWVMGSRRLAQAPGIRSEQTPPMSAL
jgi:hypothetical protein